MAERRATETLLFFEDLVTYIAAFYKVAWVSRAKVFDQRSYLRTIFTKSIGEAVNSVVEQLRCRIRIVGQQLNVLRIPFEDYVKSHIVNYALYFSGISFYIRSAYLCYLAILCYLQYNDHNALDKAVILMAEDFEAIPAHLIGPAFSEIQNMSQTVATRHLSEIGPFEARDNFLRWYEYPVPGVTLMSGTWNEINIRNRHSSIPKYLPDSTVDNSR